jgi:mannose-1-phosphate guanylyltransferase/mannose-6-phosphate isomerase
MKIIILAGGSGTRLWPLSRLNYPKQFLKLQNNKSLLQNTAERFLSVVKPEDIIVITNNKNEFNVRSDISWLTHIILEPVGRNTAPAIALAVKYCTEKLGCGKEEVLFISPADHIIEPREKFSDYLKLSEQVAQAGQIVTFGIKPDKPETGYGYIQIEKQEKHNDKKQVYPAQRFVEKPDIETARRYLADGDYYWNSGMFAFSIATIMQELSNYAPDVYSALDMGLKEMLNTFVDMPSISIDYAIMEKSERVKVIPAELYWNDIGSWDSVFDMSPAGNNQQNSKAADNDTIMIDSENTITFGDHRLIATVGLKDCVIVDTEDALLVAKKGNGQKVKNIMEQLTAAKRKEAADHITTYRPWGSFTNLLERSGYKVKKISVNPGEKLSLQYHNHRTEHWTIVKGEGRITVGKSEKDFHENDTVHIPVTVPHRVENCGSAPLDIIEVQYGEYCGEDDIVRIEDIYGRKDQSNVEC